MDKVKFFYKAVWAGVFNSIAATLFLMSENRIVGSFLFTFGLFCVAITQSNLYTGMAGYFPQRKWWELVMAFVGNLVGCMVYGLAYGLSACHEKIYERVYQLCEFKFQANLLSIFLMSALCGALVFLGVDTFKKHRDIVGVVVAFFCIGGFVIAGFEQVVANMAYLALAKYPVGLAEAGKLLLMGFGNMVGAIGVRTMMELK